MSSLTGGRRATSRSSRTGSTASTSYPRRARASASRPVLSPDVHGPRRGRRQQIQHSVVHLLEGEAPVPPREKFCVARVIRRAARGRLAEPSEVVVAPACHAPTLRHPYDNARAHPRAGGEACPRRRGACTPGNPARPGARRPHGRATLALVQEIGRFMPGVNRYGALHRPVVPGTCPEPPPPGRTLVDHAVTHAAARPPRPAPPGRAPPVTRRRRYGDRPGLLRPHAAPGPPPPTTASSRPRPRPPRSPSPGTGARTPSAASRSGPCAPGCPPYSARPPA